MDKIARCIYLISLATGWFSLKYDKKKNCVKYSKLIHRIGRFEFYFVALSGGLGLINYHEINQMSVEFNGVLIMLMAFLQVLIYFMAIIKLYSRLNGLRFEIIHFVNKSIKIYKILLHAINFELNLNFVRILILKLIFVDFTGIMIKIIFEKVNLGEKFGILMVFRAFLATMFLNFLNLNNLYLIFMKSLLSSIHRRLKVVFWSRKIFINR